MKVIYVAGPFRGKTTWDVAQNVRQAEALGLEVATMGLMPLIPHANTQLFNGQLDDQFWLDGTLELLKRCDALVTTEDWEQSAGARGEVEYAKQTGIPVFHTTEDLLACSTADRYDAKNLLRCPVCGDEDIRIGTTNDPGVVYWYCTAKVLNNDHRGGFAWTPLDALILWHETTKADKSCSTRKTKHKKVVDTTPRRNPCRSE